MNIVDDREQLSLNTLKVLRNFKANVLTEKTDINEFPKFNYKPFWRQKFVNENGFINDSVDILVDEINVPFSIAAKRCASLPSELIIELQKNTHTFLEGEVFISSDVRKNLINEMGCTKTYPVNKSFGYLNDIFKQLRIKAHYFVNGKYIRDIYSFDAEGIVVVLVEMDKVSRPIRDIVEEVSTMCGYFLVNDGVVNNDENPKQYYSWQFEPIHQTDITKNIGRYVYHVTSANKVNKIKKNGLSVDKPKSICRYPDGRLYVFSEYDNDLFMMYIRKSWKQNIIGKNEEDGKFAVITIDREVIPDVKWYQDLQFRGEPAAYTYTYIPADAISDIEILETFNLE